MKIKVAGILKRAYGGWIRISKAVGSFNSRLLLSVVFYLLISPVSLLFKLFSKDRLEMNFRQKAGTYWIKKERPQPEKQRYERQY